MGFCFFSCGGGRERVSSKSVENLSFGHLTCFFAKQETYTSGQLVSNVVMK